MTKYTETQRKILEVGKEEFLAKGFKDASLRGIVKAAGLPKVHFTATIQTRRLSLMRWCPRPPDTLMEQFKAAQRAHYDLITEEKTAQSQELSTDYLNYFINYIYDNFDAFKLVICCSEGTRYSNYVHELVELEVSQTEKYYQQLRQLGKVEGVVNHDLHHMITSAYFTAVFETVVHDMSREQAIGYVNELAVFFNCGWSGLLRLK